MTRGDLDRQSGATMRETFLRALRERAAHQDGRVTIPTGKVGVGELARVLRALDRAKTTGARRP